MDSEFLTVSTMATRTDDTYSADASVSNPWVSVLLKAKVMAPEPPVGYLRRAALLARLEGLLDRRLTILRAPSGFGKTTVLADIARDMRERGVTVAWISLDGDDTPKLFGGYLAAAFQGAGLDLSPVQLHDARYSLSTVEQMGLVATAIELHAAPCLLVLDEIDRLPERTLQLIDLLTKRAPGNLHIAVAYRADPGFDIAAHVMNGDAIIIGAEDCRFSRAEILRFFQGKLSRRQLAGVEERTAGWPIALMACRSTRGFEGAEPDPAMAAVMENYFRVRVLHDLSAEEHAALMDMAIFDGCDVALSDEVLESTDARRRVTALPALDGLLQPIDKKRTVWRLHPVLRDYCHHQLSMTDPVRKRSLHQRLALALVRRGHFAPAWRHATELDDAFVLSKLVERTGLFRLWLREGLTQLTSAAEFLTPETTASFPHLELLRCLSLSVSSKSTEANALFDAVMEATDNFRHDPHGGDTRTLAVDGAFTQGMLVCAAGRLPTGEPELPQPAETDVDAGDEYATTVDCARHTLLCVCSHVHGRFEEARKHGMQAQARIGEDARYGAVFLDVYVGMSEMAAGRAQEAARRYRRARDGAREFDPSDPCLTMNLDVLTTELALERNRLEEIPQRSLKSLAKTRGPWIDIHVASVSLSAELTFEQYGASVIHFLTKVADPPVPIICETTSLLRLVSGRGRV